MIIHECAGCGKHPPNRIAGDDDEFQVLSILEESFNLDNNLMTKIKNLGINIVTPKNEQSSSTNKEDVLISLFGINYKKYI